MPRPSGARNHDFEKKRAALLDTLTEFALNSGVQRPSLRQFAMAAKQSEPTLRHYFVDRQGLVIEIIRSIAARSEQIWALVRAPSKDLATAVSEYIKMTEISFREGMFARSHAFGLVEAHMHAVASVDVIGDCFRAVSKIQSLDGERRITFSKLENNIVVHP